MNATAECRKCRYPVDAESFYCTRCIREFNFAAADQLLTDGRDRMLQALDRLEPLMGLRPHELDLERGMIKNVCINIFSDFEEQRFS